MSEAVGADRCQRTGNHEARGRVLPVFVYDLTSPYAYLAASQS